MPADDLKAHIKRLVKAAGMRTAMLRRRLPVVNRILTYHSVGHREHEMNVTPEAFREQMERLAEHETVISARQAAEGAPGVAVTFDDGYRDNLVNAAPILVGLGIPATVFVVTGRLGERLDHDRPTSDADLLSLDELRALDSMDGISIGAHTMRHRRLAGLPLEIQRQEIVGSVDRLRDWLGHDIEGFAYPFGKQTDYDAISVEAVRESGVHYACSNRYGGNLPGFERFALRRIWIDSTDTPATFEGKVDGRLDCLSALDSRIGIAVRWALNRLNREPTSEEATL